MKVPFLGWHLKLSGHVPVDRNAGNRAAADAIKRFTRVLEDDNQLLIFPEGTRTPDGEVQPFKNGGFYAAVRANRPVVPVALEGTYALMGKHQVDTGGGYTVAIQASEKMKVQPSAGFCGQMSALLGEGRVQVIGPTGRPVGRARTQDESALEDEQMEKALTAESNQ